MTSSEGGRSKDTHPLEYGQPDSYVPSYNQSSGQHAPRNHLRMRHSRSRGGGRSHHSNRRRDGRQTPRGSIHEAYRPDYRQPFGANGVKKTPVPDNRHGNETWSPVRGFNGHEEDSDAPTKVDDASEHEFDGAHQPTHVKGAGSNHDQGLRKMVHTGNQAIGDVPLTAFDLERYRNLSTRLDKEGSTRQFESRDTALSGRRQDDEPWNNTTSEDRRSDLHAMNPDRLIMSRSSILRPDGFGRRVMSGIRAKRARETDDDGEQDRSMAWTKHPRITTITIRDIDIPEDYFLVMESHEAKDEYRALRAYMTQVSSRLRADIFNDKDFVKSDRTSRSLDVVGWIILIPVVEFRRRKGPPEDEHLSWLDIPEGTLVVKLRPALACKNGHDSIRTKPLTSFGDSDPYTQWLDDREQGMRPKLRDYVPLLEHPPQPDDAEAEGLWFIGPLYFHSTSDWNFDRNVRFAHIYTHHNHPHTVPWKKIGELHGDADFQGFVRMEETAAGDLVNPIKKALIARTETMSGKALELNGANQAAGNKMLRGGRNVDSDRFPTPEANTAFHPIGDPDNERGQPRSSEAGGLQEEEGLSMLHQNAPAQSVPKEKRQLCFEELGWNVLPNKKGANDQERALESVLEQHNTELNLEHQEKSLVDLERGDANEGDLEGNSHRTATLLDQPQTQQWDDSDLDIWPPPSPRPWTHIADPNVGFTTLAGYLNDKAHMGNE
ncbi:hypothetical protein KC331_g4519 [Hortaea werneckii]|nr:hypothetical protein KC331_g4519 [Hortaea werneckii]KAI7722291.1 hypothetical protein KC353_g621 [Hortaea werneckii]